jgi:hypothetical protein
MFYTCKGPFENPHSGWWKHALLGAVLAIAPALALAGDKDKDKDKANKRAQSGGAAQMGSTTAPRRTLNGSQNNKQNDGQNNIFSKATELKMNNQSPNQFNSGAVTTSAKNGLSQVEGERNRSNRRTLENSNNTIPRGLNQQSQLLGTQNLNTPNTNLKIGKSDAKKMNRDDLKLNKDDLKLSKDGLKIQDDPKSDKRDSKLSKADLKSQDGLKLSNDGLKLNKGDLKHADGKKGAGNFLDLHKAGKFDGVIKGSLAKKLDLGKQFELKHKGDLAVKMNLAHKIKLHGGWAKARWAGLIGPSFGVGCSPIVYCGPGYFPSHCMWPGWSPWVEFCWTYHCDPIWDPRPWFCRPWVYDPCPVWVWWDYPVWYELPVVVSGTWVDVEPIVIDDGLDLQLLAVRFVDPGQPELREGPRYRVWGRNNSAHTAIGPFNVLLMAGNSRESAAGLPQAGVRVDSMAPGEIKAFDIRLPFEATAMAYDAEGHSVPYSQLHVIVDSHREIPEAFEQNNGAVIARGDILPVDPVIFGTDLATPIPGTEINIAGEGFGPEPGQVLVHLGGIELQAEIEGWYDLGVRVRLPSLALAGPTDAEIVLIRGDTAASNPLTIQLAMPVASR